MASVPLSTPNSDASTGIVQVIPVEGPDSQQTKDLVRAIRAMKPYFAEAYDVPVYVTGYTAVAIDVSDRLGRALLPFGILVVGLSLVLLAMVFRSVAVPLKATIGYLLSVGAAFGVTAMVFEYGWFSEIFNVGQTAPVISFLPILMMGILFGLAMDYEVFLVSRIREEYVHGVISKGDDPLDPRRAHNNTRARAKTTPTEPSRTASSVSSRIVVAAAVIMFAVFAAFVPHGEGPIKTIAFGLAVGVFVDAFVVRMTFVPAVLALLGRRAWWLPSWIDRRLPSFDVEGAGLAHQLELADWPVRGDDHLIYTDDLDPGVGAPISLAARAREVVVVSGPAAAVTGALLGLSGRHGDSRRSREDRRSGAAGAGGKGAAAYRRIWTVPAHRICGGSCASWPGPGRRFSCWITPTSWPGTTTAPRWPACSTTWRSAALSSLSCSAFATEGARRPAARLSHDRRTRAAPSWTRGPIFMITFERAGGSRRIGLWSVLGMILVPLVLAGGFLWATWDSDTRLGRVEAAVVNEDEPVTIDGQLVPLGRQLAGGLVDSDDDRNFSWVLTDGADANEGLASGRYAAVVRIPADFSARATSFAENDAAVAEAATIEVRTSEVSGIADPVVGQAITAAATKALNTELTKQYLDGVYVGFNRVAEEFEKVADASGEAGRRYRGAERGDHPDGDRSRPAGRRAGRSRCRSRAAGRWTGAAGRWSR